MVTDLPERLRLGTRDLHALSERSGVMGALLAGRLGREDYVSLMGNLHAIYAALEAALNRHPAEPALAVLGGRRFHREAALAGDLDALHGPGWQVLPLSLAAQAYAARLHGLADTAPVLLAAHAYVRYLGDLHGGQMLKRLVARSLAVAGEGGCEGAGEGAGEGADRAAAAADATRFYDFGSNDEVLALRQDFRVGLAQVCVDDATADRLVAEARWAFEQHVVLFNELSTTAAASPPQVAPPPATPAASA